MDLVPASAAAIVGRYVGCHRPYATIHEDLDRDEAVHEEVRNAARSLAETVRTIRTGAFVRSDRELHDPRPKWLGAMLGGDSRAPSGAPGRRPFRRTSRTLRPADDEVRSAVAPRS
jgi:hypothetical protein